MCASCTGKFEDELLGPADRTWEPIQNLDAFCSKVYNYYVEKGFWCIVTSRLTSLVNLAFTVCFSTFLLLFVNWGRVVRCGADECSGIIREGVLSSPTFGESIVVAYFAIFCVYWLWCFIGFGFALRDAVEMRGFFAKRLEIPDEELPTLEWYAVLDRLVKLQRKLKLCLVKDLDALDITHRIMRKDNYMVALVNAELFRFTFGCIGEHAGAFGRTLEWNLRFCLLDALFDAKFTVRGFLGHSDRRGVDAARAATRLRWRFFAMGLFNLALTPFIAIFMALFFVLKHAEDLHSKRGSLAPREWTAYARWRLREYNELPHFFARRLRSATPPARAYLAQFPTTLVAILARCVAYICGALVGILLILSLTGSKAILNVYVGDRSLVWYLAVFTGLLAIARACIPEPQDSYNPSKAMAQVVKHTHYCPPHWRKRFHEPAVHAEFSRLFQATVSVFLGELFGVLTTPLVLCFVLPARADAIVKLVQQLTVSVDGVGDICGPADFDLEAFERPRGAFASVMESAAARRRAADAVAERKGDQDAKGTGRAAVAGETDPVSPTARRRRRRRVYGDGVRMTPLVLQPDPSGEGKRGVVGGPATAEPYLSHQGKLEKSYLSFMCNHPHFKADPAGAELLTALAKVDPLMARAAAAGGDRKAAAAATAVGASGPAEDQEEDLTASRMPLSMYMSAGAVPSGNKSRLLTESDRLLVCSFSQILGAGESRAAARRVAMDPNASTRGRALVFSALESVYENQSIMDDESDVFGSRGRDLPV